MRRNYATLCLSLVLAVSVGAQAADYRPGEVIVKFKPNAIRMRADMNALYRSVGATRIKRYSGVMKGFEQIFIDESVKVEDAVADLQRSWMVEYAQPNFILRLMPEPKNKPAEACPIPGIPYPPGCEAGGGGDPTPPPGGGGACPIPGIPFPPGCDDSGGGGPGPGPGPSPGTRPDVKSAPAETIPAVVDPDLGNAYGLEKIGAIEAWKKFRGSKQFIVADIDTGIDYNHVDLAFNIWRNPSPTQGDVVGFDFIHNDGLPYDDQGHGTHTAGTIGAVGGNGVGVSGVAQQISLMGLKFLSAKGEGTTADAIRAIDYAIEHGAKVLSNSWGGPGDDGNKALFDAIERARAKDVLFIAAAGNGNQVGMGQDNDTSADRSYPASFDNDNLISVAATDKKDKLAFFSNYGKKSVHLAAPGVAVYSLAPGDKYAAHDGTSMACPHVAGAAALIWSKKPSLTYKQVKDLLLNSVDQLPSLQGKTSTGGRLNVLKALSSMD